jgi:carotenoid cleavage dioxygenase-like enzyme
MPSPTDPSNPPPPDADLDVRGAIPSGLSGRLVGVDRDGVVHSVLVGDGRVSYSGRRFRTEAVVHSLVAFGGSMLVFGDDSPAYELRPEADTLRRVDLAGHGRSLAAYPKQDPATGELHLIAHDTAGLQTYVVVSAGALTRHSRPLFDTPDRIQDLALSRDHAVLVADGFVGVAPRKGELHTTWIATGIAAAYPVHAYEAGDIVVVLALTPLLERWTLHPEAGSIQREVLDPTPRRFAHCGNDSAGGAPRCLWTTGNGTIGHHELVSARHVHCNLRPDVPGDLVFVTDATRVSDADGGWLVGFVHNSSGVGTELYVIDAAEIVGPAIATAPISRLVPRGLRCTWIPATQQ